jgi:hypothetical protein
MLSSKTTFTTPLDIAATDTLNLQSAIEDDRP